MVGVVILNWNDAPDTLRCLGAVFASDYENLHVVVVDNGSADGSVAAIRERYPDLAILENGENLGYTGGNNVGIEYALGLGVDYVWLLNDDVVIESRTLSALMTAALSHPGVGFWGPKVYALEEPQRLLSAGGQLRRGWKPAHRGMGELDRGQYDELAEVDYLSGCALLVSRKVIEAIGELDEDFFAYREDIEWCCRGRRNGFGCFFMPAAKVWHPDTNQRDSESPLVVYYTTRNSLLFVRRHRLGTAAMVSILLAHLRTLASWSLRPRWRHKRDQRNALMRAILDFALGRFGKAGGFS